MILVSPSVLACDFSRMGEECGRAAAAGADFIHFDVMDGHFVPNISMGAAVLKALSGHVSARFDVHLMVSDPLFFVRDFAEAGAHSITFHAEADSDIALTVKEIKSFGIKAGLSVKPETDEENIFKYLDVIDTALIMTVEPGFGGQKFLPLMCGKIERLKEELVRRGRTDVTIEVDGGINAETARLAALAGARKVVAGSYIFGSGDYKKAMDVLKRADG